MPTSLIKKILMIILISGIHTAILQALEQPKGFILKSTGSLQDNDALFVTKHGLTKESTQVLSNVASSISHLNDTLADPQTLKSLQEITNAQINIIVPGQTYTGATGYTLATMAAADICYHGKVQNYDVGLLIAGIVALCVSYYSPHIDKTPFIAHEQTQTPSKDSTESK